MKNISNLLESSAPYLFELLCRKDKALKEACSTVYGTDNEYQIDNDAELIKERNERNILAFVLGQHDNCDPDMLVFVNELVDNMPSYERQKAEIPVMLVKAKRMFNHTDYNAITKDFNPL